MHAMTAACTDVFGEDEGPFCVVARTVLLCACGRAREVDWPDAIKAIEYVTGR